MPSDFAMINNNINKKLLRTALGSDPADMVIKNGTLMDVYTGRLLPHRSVAIRDKWIAYVGPDAEHTISKNTRVIDAGRRLICPGYIDAHTHLATYWDISDFLAYAIPCGVTTFITETENYGFALGYEGVKAFLDQVENRPVKIYSLIPPMVSLSQASATLHITRNEVRELLGDQRVIGLGESFWQDVILSPNNRVLETIQETRKAGKSVQGHAAGAFDKKLAAYAAAGALSCHEAISSEDVLARLEMGFYAMIREGDIRRDLEIILPLKDHIDLRRLIIVTDGTNPFDLINQNYLLDVIQKAVDMGLKPIEVVKMVSLNPAEHFGIDHITGGISPGRFADLLLCPESGTMKPDLVISNGRIIAENGKVTTPLPRVSYPASLLKTVKIDPVSASDLAVPVNFANPENDIRTIDIQPGGLVTREGKTKPRIKNGQYTADPERDLLKTVFIERVSGRGEKFIGFVRGWGQKSGAVATSLCWDASAVVAVGTNDHDMATAINRVIRLQGGTALSNRGKILLDIPWEIGGYTSRMPIRDIAARLENFQQTIVALGSNLSFAHLTLNVLSTAAIPFIRMTEKGYFRFREKDIVLP